MKTIDAEDGYTRSPCGGNKSDVRGGINHTCDSRLCLKSAYSVD